MELLNQLSNSLSHIYIDMASDHTSTLLNKGKEMKHYSYESVPVFADMRVNVFE